MANLGFIRSRPMRMGRWTCRPGAVRPCRHTARTTSLGAGGNDAVASVGQGGQDERQPRQARYTMLLISATVAVAFVAALTVWAAWLGGDNWPLVLVPFGLVLPVPLAACVWLGAADPIDEPLQRSSGPAQGPVLRLDHQSVPHTSRRVA